MTDEVSFNSPATETSFLKDSKSLEGLVAKIEELFDCRDGPYRAWVEHEGQWLPYVTLGICAKVPEHSEVVAETMRNQLLHALLTIRSSLGQDRPVLYWRFAKEQRIQEETEPFTNVEGWPMRGRGRPLRQSIRTRVAVPGADWDIVDEVVTYNGTLNL